MQLYQQRDFGEKINAVFQYAVQQFRSLGLAVLCIAGPVALGAGIASGVMSGKILRQGSVTYDSGSNDQYGGLLYRVFGMDMSGDNVLLYVIAFLLSGLTPVLVHLTVNAHLKVYDRMPGAPVEVADVWREVRSVLGTAVGIALVAAILITAAILFLVLPGIYLAIVFSLAFSTLVFEHVSVGQYMGRCFDLIRGNWWATFGLIIVMSLIAYLFSMIFNLPSFIISLLVALKVSPDLTVAMTIPTSIISTVGSALVSSLVALGTAFQYFNLVEQREGKSLLSAIEQIGTAPPPTKPRTSDEGDY